MSKVFFKTLYSFAFLLYLIKKDLALTFPFSTIYSESPSASFCCTNFFICYEKYSIHIKTTNTYNCNIFFIKCYHSHCLKFYFLFIQQSLSFLYVLFIDISKLYSIFEIVRQINTTKLKKFDSGVTVLYVI
jgi:hypothetical protein